jgi:hypothetical protein
MGLENVFLRIPQKRWCENAVMIEKCQRANPLAYKRLAVISRGLLDQRFRIVRNVDRLSTVVKSTVETGVMRFNRFPTVFALGEILLLETVVGTSAFLP